MRAGTAPPKPPAPRPAPGGEAGAFAPGERDPPAPEGGRAHFVLKRGHHGRYRFSLRNEFGGISGEVFVPPDHAPRTDQEARAHRTIAQLARSLLTVLDPPS